MKKIRICPDIIYLWLFFAYIFVYFSCIIFYIFINFYFFCFTAAFSYIFEHITALCSGGGLCTTGGGCLTSSPSGCWGWGLGGRCVFLVDQALQWHRALKVQIYYTYIPFYYLLLMVGIPQTGRPGAWRTARQSSSHAR